MKSFFINTYGNWIRFSNEIDVMHKYGRHNQYFHDSGIVLDSDPYIIIVLTQHGNGSYRSIINNISKLIYKYHTSN